MLRRRSVLTLSALLLAAGVSPALLSNANAEDGKVIATAVGDGESGDTGDGSSAVSARLNEPRMIAFDGKGGYYVADTYNHRIRLVDGNGVITNVAGNGQPGFRDGPGAQAMFNAPHSVDVDGAGNVIVGDPLNNRVRKIDASGNVTTIAGYTDRRLNPSPAGTVATEAGLHDSKIALVGPDGNVYVADYGNSVIQRIRMDRQPATIETFAGVDIDTGPFCERCPATEAFFKPRNITFDVDGDLIVADRESNTVRSIAFKPDGTAGDITRIAGIPGAGGYAGDGGPALEAQLFEPRGLGVDWMGNVYIADSSNNRVRRVDTQGVISTVAGTGDSGKGGIGASPTEADLNNPRHVIFDAAGTMYVTDTGGHRVLKVANFIPPKPVTTPTTSPTTPTTSPTTPTTSGGGPITQPGAIRSGYWMLGSDGALYPFGQAGRHGDPMRAMPASAVAADVEGTPTGEGYWVLDTTGKVHNFGDATALGSLNRAILTAGETATSLSSTPTGKGYWVFTTRGRAVAFGDATHLGDMVATRLNAPVLDSVATPSGKGYFMVAGDGGIFTFGDAKFAGSMGDKKLNAPVQSLVPDGDGKGYWLVASDGGVFAFEAPFRGSMGGTRLNKPITGMVRQGNGYLMVAEDGGIFNFSDMPFSGSLGDNPPTRPIVAVAILPR